jgi:hypothetical protein
MAFKKKFDGQTDTTIQLGDKNNPVPVSIEGYFLGTKEIPDGGYGPGKLHIFQTANGATGVWGKTNSNRLLTRDLIGTMVRLTFTGMGPKVKGKNQAYTYELEVDATETMDVTGIDVGGTQSQADDEDGGDVEPTPTPRAALQQSAGPTAKAAGTSATSQGKLQAMLNSRRSGASA